MKRQMIGMCEETAAHRVNLKVDMECRSARAIKHHRYTFIWLIKPI